MNKLKTRQAQKGITIIEVLVAMLILAVGLLGMASLQVRAVQDTTNASFRSIAIFYANDMADRIRANPGGGDYGNGAGTKTANCLTVTGCSATAMREHDIAEWRENILGALPAGTGVIAKNGAIYTITVQWSDRVDAEDVGGNKTNTATSSVAFTFEP